MRISENNINSLRKALDDACTDRNQGIPGVVGVAVGKDGKELFAHAAGWRGFGSEELMTLDNIFWIASCTKMITGIACMQLVEQKKLSLDDATQIESLCPELKNVQVLRQDGKLESKKTKITLRMLLAHTSGCGYSFFHDGLRDYSKPIGYDEFSGHVTDFQQPLVHQPGEGWQYGIGIDFAGFCVERTTGLSLDQYFRKNIFEPLGLHNISMFPHQRMKSSLAYMNARATDGQLSPRDHLLRRSLIVESKADIDSCVNSGGAGCFAKPREYCQILSTLLNDGVSPMTGARILQKRTVDLMFQNQIPHFPKFGKQGIPPAKPDLTNAIPDLYPGEDQGWGLTFMISDGPTGRSKTTGHWAGLPNLYWWCDREQGIAGMIATQVLPFADPQVLNLWVAFESGVYGGLV